MPPTFRICTYAPPPPSHKPLISLLSPATLITLLSNSALLQWRCRGISLVASTALEPLNFRPRSTIPLLTILLSMNIYSTSPMTMWQSLADSLITSPEIAVIRRRSLQLRAAIHQFLAAIIRRWGILALRASVNLNSPPNSVFRYFNILVGVEFVTP